LRVHKLFKCHILRCWNNIRKSTIGIRYAKGPAGVVAEIDIGGGKERFREHEREQGMRLVDCFGR